MQANNNTGPPVSLSEIKRIFQIPIIRIKPISNLTQYFQAVTAYGNMSLLLQSYQNSNSHTQYLTFRNRFIHANYKCFPLVYEQHVLQYKNIIVCATLIEDCISLYDQISRDHSGIKSLWFGKLIRSLDLMQKQELWLKNGLAEKGLLFLTNSQQIVFDFTAITQQIEDKKSHLDGLIKVIQHLLEEKYRHNKQINEIIFINGKIYAFDTSKLNQVTDYQELLLFLNLCPNLEVELIAKSVKPLTKNGVKNGDSNKPVTQNGNHENKQLQKKKVNDKIKRMSLKNLEDNPTIRINSKEYKSLVFADGKCLNCLRQIFYEELSSKFIQECSLYKLQQFQLLVVNIFKNKTQQSRRQQIVTVYPPVNKSELISFLIAYIKCINPVIKSIQYIEGQNTLKIVFENRKQRQKILRIVFYQEYIVKDEEISMILQKSNLFKCRLDLRNMKISDTFLIFLSHSEKTSDIFQLYLTNNEGLSDIGLCTFLKSSYSNSLKTLSLTINNENALEETLELISRKQSLQKLYLKKLSLNSSSFGEQIDVSYMKLVQLQSLGLGVTFSSVAKGNLKILRLDQMVPLQELKNIKHLRLTQLKLRINQNQKKSLMDSFSNFSSITSSFTSSLSLNGAFNNKIQPARVFAEGQSRLTLRKLDISYSNCKYKSLKPLFQMQELQNLSMEGCIGLGGEYEPICSKILMLSMADVDINQEQLSVMLHNHKELVELNIINAKIVKQDIIQLVSKKKIFIANLIISQHQYSNKLIQMSSGYELIGCVQLYIQRLLQPQQEYSLNSLLAKASQSEKHVRFVLSWKQQKEKQAIQQKKQTLMDKINNFLIMSNISIQSLQNIYINKMRITELLEIKQNFEVEDTCESEVASSVSLARERCKISSSHKIMIRRNNEIPVLFKILQKQTIDKFTHRFVKFMQDNSLPMSVDLSQNKIVGKQIIHILHRYGKKLIKQLNFRNCMFGINDVIDTLFQFSGLEMINTGHYEIYLNKQNFNSRSQKYLKLFMRTRQVIQLKIYCQQIQEVQILFSVLNHILDQSAPTLQSLYIIFSQMPIDKESISFFKVLFSLNSLQDFQFLLRQCDKIDKRCSQIWFKNFNSLESLQKLSLILPSSSFPLINLPNLKEFYMEFSDVLIDQNTMSKCLKNLSNSKNLKAFRISLANCINISNLNRVFGVIPTGFLIQRLTNLETLSLNFEYCPIKQQSLFELIVSLPKCQYLKMFELNVSFTIVNFNDFLSCIQKLVQDFARPVGIKIICVTQNSSQFMLRTQSLSQKGVQFII